MILSPLVTNVQGTASSSAVCPTIKNSCKQCCYNDNVITNNVITDNVITDSVITDIDTWQM